MPENDVLETQVRALEKENRALKQTLLDKYAAAALTGMLNSGDGAPDYFCTSVVPNAFVYAHMAVALRERSFDELVALAVGPDGKDFLDGPVKQFRRFLDPDQMLKVIYDEWRKS